MTRFENPDRKASGPISRENELRLHFRQWGLWEPFYFKIDWPLSRPLLVATLDTFNSGGVGPVDAKFVIENLPSGFKVYFAATRENGHDELERMLHSHGDWYEERMTPTSRPRSRISDMLSGRMTRVKKKTLFASSSRVDIIESLFKLYELEWYVKSVFPFIVASRDPPDWVDQLTNLAGVREQRVIRAASIENSYCIMTTIWEHGMNIVSDKMTRPQLEERAKRVSAEHNLRLSIDDAETRAESSAKKRMVATR